MKRSIVITGVIMTVVAAGVAGYLLRLPAGPGSSGLPTVDSVPAAPQVYTCSMHPQVRLDGPGRCPICEMPLIPANAAAPSGEGPPSLTLSERALAMASVETASITYRELGRDLRAVGKIGYNESTLATVTTRVDGYAEKLFVNITGVDIEAGDHLMEVYSPELLVGQQELLIALQGGKTGPLVEAARLKLLRWGLTAEQIADLVDARKMTNRITLYAPMSGTVIEKTIVENSAFKAGDALYRIANLDAVWAYLEIYELDLAWLRYGQDVELTAEAYPGQVFKGMVTFVEPVLNEETRTVRVPVYVENPQHLLKPGMYVSAAIKVALGPDGQAAPTGVEGKFTCRMHPQVVSDATGACPVCGMPLERIAGQEHPPAVAQEYKCPMACEGDKTYDALGNCPVCGMKLEQIAAPAEPDQAAAAGLLAVPVSAVLDSGRRTIVYVEKGRGMFESREVTLGPRSGDFYPVFQGLAAGERVVTRGGFLIDSQFQIMGQPSLYYPGGLYGSTEAAPGIKASTEQSMSEELMAPSAGGHRH